MLSGDSRPAGAAPAQPAPLRLMSVCEDVAGALRLTRFLAGLTRPVERHDLSALDAVERLRDSLAAPADLVVFAPAPPTEGVRPVAQELVELATHRASRLVVLIAPGQAHDLVLAPSVEVVVIDADAVPHRAARGFGGRLGRWLPRIFGRKPVEEVAAPGEEAFVEGPARPLRLISLQALAGGAGSSTVAGLLAAEIAAQHPGLNVLLIDLDLQFGQIGAYRDLREDGRITDFYGAFGKLDVEAFRACLFPLAPNLQVLAAPPEILPHDALDPRKMVRFLTLARESADLVLLDLPHTVAEWMEPIWREAELMISIAQLDLRSSFSFRRLKALSEGHAFDPRRSEIWLNRVSPRPKGEEAEMTLSLMQAFRGVPSQQLPEGGPQIRQAQTQGLCPREAAASSALVREIARQAARLGPRLPTPSGGARQTGQ